jgi:anhydro-N-acetylmuramic acid kinase
MTLAIGLMSGTSADGLDAALVKLDPQPQLIASHSHRYSSELSQQLRQLALAQQVAVEELMAVQHQLAQGSVHSVHALLQSAGVTASEVSVIGSHGHTLRHQPQPQGFSWQLDDPSWIAEHTGICVVADMRRRDIAAGGQGAPLVPAFHRAMMAEHNGMVLNIGGIANLTVLQGDDVYGFDCGPGNTLLDEYCQQQQLGRCDMGGQLAAQGQADMALVEQWLQHEFFQRPPPRSTGRELFHLAHYPQLVSLAAADALATLTQFSAASIAAAINAYGLPQGPLWVCGGGVHNATLMQALQTALPHHSLASTEVLGMNPDWVEAMAFAWLAQQTLTHQAGSLASVTGARGGRILGGIYPA